MQRKNIQIMLFSILFLSAVVFCFIYLYLSKTPTTPNNKEQADTGLPQNQNNAVKSETADLDKDVRQEEYILENGILQIVQGNKIVWKSPGEWRIDNFVLGDANNDGSKDLNLSVWKSGDFGSSKPFWVKENDMSVKNHFFVFDFVNGTIIPVWQSSNLDMPNCEFDILDVDRDGKNDLVVIEGDYSQKPTCPGNYIAVWKWNGWGFANEWRSDKGQYKNIDMEQVDTEMQNSVREKIQ